MKNALISRGHLHFRAPDDDRSKLSLRVHLRIASCRNLLMREARRSVERDGLTLPQFDILAELDRAPRKGFTFGELSRLLLVTSGNLTGIVDHLEGDGLAKRQHDKRDRRVVRIVLTRKGRQLIQQVAPRHARDIHEALGFLSDDRMRTLEELLREMGDGLQDRAPAASSATSVPVRPRGRGRRSLLKTALAPTTEQPRIPAALRRDLSND